MQLRLGNRLVFEPVAGVVVVVVEIVRLRVNVVVESRLEAAEPPQRLRLGAGDDAGQAGRGLASAAVPVVHTGVHPQALNPVLGLLEVELGPLPGVALTRLIQLLLDDTLVVKPAIQSVTIGVYTGRPCKVLY